MINSPDKIVALYITLTLLCIVIVVLFVRAKKENSESDPEEKDLDQAPPFSDIKSTAPCVKDQKPALEEAPKPPVALSPIPDNPSIEDGVTFLKAGELSQAERCLQCVLDKAAEEEDLLMLREARYFLAKVNKEMGDLTLACEHWQIARDLYQDSEDSEKLSEIEEDMRQNGCPTDWVLNGF